MFHSCVNYYRVFPAVCISLIFCIHKCDSGCIRRSRKMCWSNKTKVHNRIQRLDVSVTESAMLEGRLFGELAGTNNVKSSILQSTKESYPIRRRSTMPAIQSNQGRVLQRQGNRRPYNSFSKPEKDETKDVHNVRMFKGTFS